MLISPAPIAIPVNTANVPTEALATEVVSRPQIPQPTSPTESKANKNTTEFSDQAKTANENDVANEDKGRVNEKQQDSQNDGNGQKEESNENQQQRNEQELDLEQQTQVRQLQNRDREVRAHEQAHASVGGNLAGAPNLNFTTGPDGKRYAVSGDVAIDISPVANDPAATIRKLEQVQRAALAPANPSSQDRRVASRAASSANQARAELNIERLEESKEARETQRDDLKESNATSRPEQSNAARNTGSSSVETSTNSSENLSSASQPGKVILEQTNSTPLNSQSVQSGSNVNPSEGRRLAENLALRIIGSGAFTADEVGGNVSIRA